MGSLPAPRPFGDGSACAAHVPAAVRFDFGSVSVGGERAAPTSAPIQRVLRNRFGRVAEEPEEEEAPPRPAPSLSTQVSQAAAPHIANAQQQPSTLLPYAASAASLGASTLVGDNPVSTLLNTATTVQSTYNDLSRGAAELGNAEYGNAALSGTSALARFGGYVGGLFGIGGSGVASTAATTVLGKAKKKQHSE